MATRMVLIHGAWLNSESWDDFKTFFEGQGYDVMAPEWPRRPVAKGDEQELAGLGVAEIVEHYQQIIQGLPEPPVIVGHSFGGLFTEILLNRGLGLAGVALDPAPARGVLRVAFSELKVGAPALLHPSRREGVFTLSAEQFAYGMTNTWPPEEAAEAYKRYNVPETGKIFYEDVFALFEMQSPVEVDYARSDRAPLLMTAGEHDHTVPPSVVKSAYEKYKKQSKARTDFVEFPGRSHLLVTGPGWQDVAEYTDRWLSDVLPKDKVPQAMAGVSGRRG